MQPNQQSQHAHREIKKIKNKEKNQAADDFILWHQVASTVVLFTKVQ